MTVLLLGKDGQLGTAILRALSNLGSINAIGRKTLNLEDLVLLERFLLAQRPRVIINAAAYTAVDKAEIEKNKAYLLNQKVVAVLAEYAYHHQALLVHYSTDYVFDGFKDLPYLETDRPNPQNVYGASKFAGENEIIQSGCQYLIFRTSWVVSYTGKNFINTILKLAKEKDSLCVVMDQLGVPTTADFIADITIMAIKKYQMNGLNQGLYHLTPSGKTNWYAFACHIIDNALKHGMALKLGRNQIRPITAVEYPLPAKRPQNSCLNNHKLSQALGVPFFDWSTYIDLLLETIPEFTLQGIRF